MGTEVGHKHTHTQTDKIIVTIMTKIGVHISDIVA